MLKRRRSLAFRASLIFAAVYAAIFLAVITISALFTWADRSEGNQLGPVLARDYAIRDLRLGPDSAGIVRDGKFLEIAERNPSIWLVVLRDGQTFTWGKVTPAITRTVADLKPVSDSALFRVPGASSPVGGAALRQIEVSGGTAIVAAGGVDPASLTTGESMQLLRDPTVAVMLIVIALLSLLGMVVAARAFSRALGPISDDAEAIGPDDPSRRLTEDKAPTELLPLVRRFNAALDRLERELGRRKRFITDVAHELRTPLAVVTLQADGLSDVAGKAELQRGLTRITRLLSQMLDLERMTLATRMETGIDLSAIVRDVVADLAPMAIARGYTLSFDSPGDPVLVTADPHAIQRAVVNIVGNAIAHGGGRGEIRVEVGKDRTIEVRDQGPGVPHDLQPRLFEPFARGHSDEEGSGLGLHLAREIMRSHRGDIHHVASETGASFRMTLPDGPTGPVETD